MPTTMRIFQISIILFFSSKATMQTIKKKAVVDKFVPVIGIFAQTSKDIETRFPQEMGYSYISASYAKWVESAGGRAVPIPYNLKTQSELDHILEGVNGVLMPGGDASLWDDEVTKEAFSNMTIVGQRIYEKAKKMNDQGIHFPIWATCMSYELILLVETQDPKYLEMFNSKNHPLNTTLSRPLSKLFQTMPPELIEPIEKEEVFYYNHQYGLSPQKFENTPKLKANYDLTGYATFEGQVFIGSLEHKKYPFILTQFHPEKNAFEFKQKINANHGANAVRASWFGAKYLMDHARQNGRRATNEWINQRVIENYSPINSISWSESGFVEIFVLRANKNQNLPALSELLEEKNQPTYDMSTLIE